MKLGNKISKLRKERNFTQKEMADFLGVSDKAVSKWETGESNPEVELLPKIAKLLGVTTDYLLSSDSNDPAPKKEEKPQQAPKEPVLSKKIGYTEKDIKISKIAAVVSAVVGVLSILLFFPAWREGFDGGAFKILEHASSEGRLAGFILGTLILLILSDFIAVFQLKYSKINWISGSLYFLTGIMTIVSLVDGGKPGAAGIFVAIIAFILGAINLFPALAVFFRDLFKKN